MKTNIRMTAPAETEVEIVLTDAGAECLELRRLAREAVRAIRSQHLMSDQERHLLADRLDKAVSAHHSGTLEESHTDGVQVSEKDGTRPIHNQSG